MTPEQIQLVQESFDRVFPVKDDLSATFYAELFRVAPAVRPLFAEDMTAQRLKLSDTLSYVIRNLDRPEVIEETVVGLARRHVKYGAKPDHFAAVGMALVHALQTHMPGGLDEQAADAWLNAYSLVSDMMIAELPTQAA